MYKRDGLYTNMILPEVLLYVWYVGGLDELCWLVDGLSKLCKEAVKE